MVLGTWSIDATSCMDALKSYSGEESSSEDETNEKDLNYSACGQDEVSACYGKLWERSKVMFKL